MKRSKYIVGLIILIFFVISFLTNVIGPLMPDMINGFSLSFTLAAVLPFSFFIAYGVISIPSGILIEKYKEKTVVVAAFVVAFFGSLILAIFPDYLSAIGSLFLIGCGMAMLQVVINPLLRTAGGEEHYAFYSILAQLVFGLASFISPLVYSGLVQGLARENSHNAFLSLLSRHVPASLPWISLYWLFTGISLVMILIVLISRFPKVELSVEEKPGAVATQIMLIKQRVVILFFIAMLCYVGTEQGVANWISQFLSTYHGVDPQKTGADTVAYFWGLMTAGGLLGLVLVKLMDSRRVLILFTALAMVCLSAGLFGTVRVALVAFPMVGFFASVLFPIIFSLALNSVTAHHGAFSGIMVTGIIGGAIAPLVIGWLGDHFGLRAGMCFLYLTLGYILSVGFWARPIIANKTIRLFRPKKHDKYNLPS
ncbi:MAG: MFS transporter [Bacteroidota bacterium]|nr:MFS transporter [Bacteroidota bacterium]MDP4216530.1 MFS transporter [Bacteroidota bacterium]MDP4246243.1 MFS transporter [Bacteroidota bacterium]MDP4254522.1 MFS transporter [Bacteroidota bacterium]MDP4257451.1 MFS transporter [Bacteroidota bacterium]